MLHHYSIRSGHDLDLRPLTLKTFSAVGLPTHILNICEKFHWNYSTTYRDTASGEIDANGQRTDTERTDGNHTRKRNASSRLLLALGPKSTRPTALINITHIAKKLLSTIQENCFIIKISHEFL